MGTVKKALIVTHLSGFLFKFGIDNIRLLQELGYEVHYASNGNEQGYVFDTRQMDEMGVIFHHIDIARSPYMIRMNLKALRQLVRIIEEEHICMIHCHTPVGGMLGRLAGSLCFRLTRKPKVIYTAHGFHFYKGAPLFNNIVYQGVERFLARFTDVLIVINREDYQSAATLHLRKSGEVYQIPGIGIDFSYFSAVSEEKRQQLRERLGIKPEEIFILSVGELNENKNHRVFLEAMSKIRNEHLFDDKVLYGICGDGYYKKEIRKYAQILGISDRVRFFGYRCNIRDYYGAADATVFPSKREGLGMAGLESLAMEIPVIASDNRGTREYMQKGKNGFVCTYDDIDGYLEGIRWMAEMPADDWKKLKSQCRKSIRRFDKNYTNKIMFSVYQKMDQRILKNE